MRMENEVKIEIDLEKYKKPNSYYWHKWYAWFPVHLEPQSYSKSQYVWLEPVYRRLHTYRDDFGYEFHRWKYTLDENINDYSGSWEQWKKE